MGGLGWIVFFGRRLGLGGWWLDGRVCWRVGSEMVAHNQILKKMGIYLFSCNGSLTYYKLECNLLKVSMKKSITYALGKSFFFFRENIQGILI